MDVKAYVVVQETVKDEEKFAAYRTGVVGTLEEYGGRFIVRGGHLTVVEGEWPHPRLVVIEFPSRAAAEGWYRSPAPAIPFNTMSDWGDDGRIVPDAPVFSPFIRRNRRLPLE
jgi:uncharacterized protein (DUF1330 family)